MSCTQNGFAISEGRRPFAMMPAIVQCDNRHAIDPRPLTREQIAKIKGVHFPAPKVTKAPAQKVVYEYRRMSDEDTGKMLRMYADKKPVTVIAKELHRTHGTIREELIRLGVHNAVYRSRIRGEHLAKKQEGATK